MQNALIQNGAKLIVAHSDKNHGPFISGAVNIGNGSSLTVDSTASEFSTYENGKIFINASDFGTFSQDGSFVKNGTIDKVLDNKGNLTITNHGFVGAIDAELYVALLKNALTLTENTGTITFEGVDMSNIFSLSTVDDGYDNGTIIAGTLSGNKTVGTTKVVNDVNLSSSVIESGSILTIHGGEGLSLIEGDMQNDGTLKLHTGTVQGAYTGSGTASILGNVIFSKAVSNNGVFSVANGSHVNFVNGINTSNGGNLVIDGTTTVGNRLEIADGGSLEINSTLDVSDIDFVVASTATNFKTGENGILIADVADFASITQATGVIDTSSASVKKQLENTGTLILENLGFASMEYNAYNTFLDTAKDATNGFVSGGKLSLYGVNIDTADASADDIIDGTSLSENVFRGGTLGQHQTENIEIAGTTSDTTNNSEIATLTGKGDANGVLVGGDFTNNSGSHANLGSNGEESKITGDFKNSGTAKIVGKVTTQNTVTTGSDNGFEVDNEAEYNTNKLTADSNTEIKVGNLDTIGKGGILRANEVSLRGGAVNLDPEFTANGIADASKTVFNILINGIDGDLLVGKSSYLVLGDTTENWAEETFNTSGLTWGDSGNEIGSALFIRTPQTLDAALGAVIVDTALPASPNTTPNTVTFGSNSLLAVDANGIGSTAALTATDGTLAVDGTSKLLIVDGKAKQELVIVDGFTDNNGVTKSAWGIVDAEHNLVLTSQGLHIDSTHFDETLGKYVVTLKASFLPEDYPMMQYSTGQYIKTIADSVGFDTDSQNTGVKFISRAIDDRYMDVENKNLLTSTVEGALQMAGVSAVAGTALDVTKAGNRAIGQQNNLSASLTEDGFTSTNTGSKYMQNGFGAWLTPIYGHANASGFDSGHFDSGYQSNFGGTAIGADYTINNSLRFGFGVNVGTGSSESKGDFNKTENDFDYLGGALYASYFMDNFAVSGDISYTALDGELEQKLPASMGMSNLKSDVDSDVFSLGVMAEYRFNFEHFDLTPYVGLRYSHVATDGYSIHSADGAGSGHVAKVASDSQDVFSIPVGVTISKEIETANGWEIAPKMELGVVANFGDLEATSKASIADVPAVSTLKMDNVDGFAFMGGLGIEVKKDNLSLNLNYHLEASEHKQNHGVFANIEYKF